MHLVVSLLLLSYGPPQKLADLSDPAINESSGLAASPSQDGTFYTHNDSGDGPRFFRFETTGKVTGVFTLGGAQAIDWEDMAAAKVGGKSYLYLGDIGDNARQRKSIVIYRVPEPTGASRTLTTFDRYEVTYPDQARDCEALMVHAQTGDIYLVSKAREGVTVAYRLPAPKSSGRFQLTKLGEWQLDTGGLGGKLVTAGDVTPDGKRIALRTYSGIFEYAAPKDFRTWWKQTPLAVTPPQELQGEAICYSRDGQALLTSSEGRPCPISRILRKSGR